MSQATAFRTSWLGSETSCPLLQLGTVSMEVAPLLCQAPPRKQERTSGDPRGRNKSENLGVGIIPSSAVTSESKGGGAEQGEEAGRDPAFSCLQRHLLYGGTGEDFQETAAPHSPKHISSK